MRTPARGRRHPVGAGVVFPLVFVQIDDYKTARQEGGALMGEDRIDGDVSFPCLVPASPAEAAGAPAIGGRAAAVGTVVAVQRGIARRFAAGGRRP